MTNCEKANWTYFGSVFPIQLEFNLPHVRLKNDRFHLGGQWWKWKVIEEVRHLPPILSLHPIVMSQKQKSEGEAKPFILTKEAVDIAPGPSQAEVLLRVTSGIAAELIKAYDSGQSVSLNEVRAKISKKHGYGGVPRLVDIISAIPDDYKKALLPKLRARPIRTASGVCFIAVVPSFSSHRCYP